MNQLERVKTRLYVIQPNDEDIQKILIRILESSIFYGQEASMSDIMTASSKTRNTVKSKLSVLPVRTIVSHRQRYYKLDTRELRRIMRRYES